MSRTLFPLFADLHDRPVLLVGGGAIAERKAQLLLDAGARISVGAPALTATLQAWCSAGQIAHLPGSFQPDWLPGKRLVIAATDDLAVNRQVAAAAEAHNVFVNVVDSVELSSFQVPATIHRTPLVIAISSGGAAPMLARRVRERLEASLEQSLGPLARLLEGFRARIRARFPNLAQRRRFYEEILGGEVPRLVEQAQLTEASYALSEALETADTIASGVGRVTLVGAGPGNPELLTLAALRALNTADVILFDRLVSPGILAMARRDAVMIDVGKQGGGLHVPQQRTHELLLEHARNGSHVVRLFVTKYLTGLLFVALQVGIFATASYFVIGIRGGVWENGIFLAVPLVVCFFSYLFAACVLFGVITRSTLAAVLLTILCWFFLFCLDRGEVSLLLFKTAAEREAVSREKRITYLDGRIAYMDRQSPEQRERSQNVADSWRQERESLVAERESKALRNLAIAHRVAYGMKTVLPKTRETTELMNRKLLRPAQGDFRSDDESTDERRRNRAIDAADIQKLDETMRARSVGWVIGTSLGFEAVVLALAAWIFSRRDF